MNTVDDRAPSSGLVQFTDEEQYLSSPMVHTVKNSETVLREINR